jgi:hypothetical protein
MEVRLHLPRLMTQVAQMKVPLMVEGGLTRTGKRRTKAVIYCIIYRPYKQGWS